MSELDRLKEKIQLEKQLLFVLLAADLALAGWFFSNLSQLKPVYLLVFAGSAVIVVSIGLAFLYRRIQNMIEGLRDL